MSSATNFALYVALLVTSDRDSFGRSVALLAVYQLVLAGTRSMLSEPLVASVSLEVGRSGASRVATDHAWRRCRSGLWMFGFGAALVTVILGVGLDANPVMVAALAAALPILLYQDGLRHLGWGVCRPQLAVGIDAVWLAVAAALVPVVIGNPGVGWRSPVLAWLAGGVVSAAAGAMLLGDRPERARPFLDVSGTSLDPGVALRVKPAELVRLGRSQAIQSTAFNLLPIAAAIMISPGAAGVLKAALLPFTPLLTIFAGLRLVSVPAMHQVATVAVGGGPPDGERSGEAVEPARSDNPAETHLDRVTVRLLTLTLPAAVATALSVIGVGAIFASRRDAVALGASALDSVALDTSVLAWGGGIAVMSIATKVLADGLAFGRRPVAVVSRRLWALGVEWVTLFAVAWLLSEDLILAGWGVGIALGTLIWLAPTLGRSAPVPAGA
jgi:hypothetical protein